MNIYFEKQTSTGTASTNNTYWHTGGYVTIDKDVTYVVGEGGKEVIMHNLKFSKKCQFCGNTSGMKDSRGGCVSCGGMK